MCVKDKQEKRPDLPPKKSILHEARAAATGIYIWKYALHQSQRGHCGALTTMLEHTPPFHFNPDTDPLPDRCPLPIA